MSNLSTLKFQTGILQFYLYQASQSLARPANVSETTEHAITLV